MKKLSKATIEANRGRAFLKLLRETGEAWFTCDGMRHRITLITEQNPAFGDKPTLALVGKRLRIVYETKHSKVYCEASRSMFRLIAKHCFGVAEESYNAHGSQNQ
jgi:hypothetical protein